MIYENSNLTAPLRCCLYLWMKSAGTEFVCTCWGVVCGSGAVMLTFTATDGKESRPLYDCLDLLSLEKKQRNAHTQ